ncbi:hypothetical protein [Prosthecobacter sp.]|uniref:hypothetical protein n=1 Tax=Prosthecobacter sp. TaxID=1965333 RepID=UPI002487417E|nr:hypothetical protein [Prosthecobacter sp.]MDI1313603.1 hypothetical protein [Prosthecobacter sp.]
MLFTVVNKPGVVIPQGHPGGRLGAVFKGQQMPSSYHGMLFSKNGSEKCRFSTVYENRAAEMKVHGVAVFRHFAKHLGALRGIHLQV